MRYNCQLFNSLCTRDQMTPNLTIIRHRMAFNKEQNPYRIVKANYRPVYQSTSCPLNSTFYVWAVCSQYPF